MSSPELVPCPACKLMVIVGAPMHRPGCPRAIPAPPSENSPTAGTVSAKPRPAEPIKTTK
jgi:hypothetical protein